MTEQRSKFAPRPTVYNGIKMRSRLEAGFAMWLDEMGAVWEYESECFASPLGQYLPDFKVDIVYPEYHSAVMACYIEVKPNWEAVNPEQQWKHQQIIWSCTSGGETFGLAIRDDGAAFPSLWTPAGKSMLIPYLWTTSCLVEIDGVETDLGLVAPLSEPPWPDGYWKTGD